MKKILLIIINIFSCCQLPAQKTSSNNLLAEYNLSINSFQYKGILQFVENKSIFCWYDSSISQRKITQKGSFFSGDLNLRIADTTKNYIEVNYLTNQILETKLLNQTNILSIREPIPLISWYILNDTKNFGKFQCVKAITSFRGRKYIAWFCPDLPYNIGPWKFSGLPGLILEIEDSDKFAHFEISSIIINSMLQKVLNYPNLKLMMSRNDFLSKRDKEQKEQDKREESRFSQKYVTVTVETTNEEMEIED